MDTLPSWPSGLRRRVKATYNSGMLLYEKNPAFEHRCERSLLHTTRNSNVCTYFKLQRKSTVVNEIDGCHKGLKNDMCATYSADLELHSMCSSIYHIYYYVVHRVSWALHNCSPTKNCLLWASSYRHGALCEVSDFIGWEGWPDILNCIVIGKSTYKEIS